MEANHPDFKFAWTKSVFYNFRRIHEDGLYDCIFFQRDGQTGALAVELATTYDPSWNGAQTFQLGRNTGLANLKFGKPNAIEAELNWYAYGNSKSQLGIVLAEISGDLRIHALNFFEGAARQLHSDKLLQHGLELTRSMLPLHEKDHAQLLADLKAAQYMARNLRNHLFERSKSDLGEFARNNGLSTEYIEWYWFGLLSILESDAKPV